MGPAYISGKAIARLRIVASGIAVAVAQDCLHCGTFTRLMALLQRQYNRSGQEARMRQASVWAVRWVPY
jgi:hypothetical protein